MRERAVRGVFVGCGWDRQVKVEVDWTERRLSHPNLDGPKSRFKETSVFLECKRSIPEFTQHPIAEWVIDWS